MPTPGVFAAPDEWTTTTAVEEPADTALQPATDVPPTVDDDRSTEGETWGLQGEVNRASKDYGRWIQSALNRILGLRLTVDGVIGPQTRSAVRTFQSRVGITADGVVGPVTERHLVQQGAGQPPGTALPAPAPPPTPSNLSVLRQKIVQIALGELARWRDGQVREHEPGIRAVLADYWKTGTGASFQEANWWSNYPWSAAFISWVMRKAGVGSAFKYSSGHAVYIHAAKQNRLQNSNNPIKAYRLTEIRPQPGDLVCKSRSGSGATYDNIQPGMSTHCDIVTEVRPGQLTTVGGNVSDSVKRTMVRTDSGGFVNQSGYFAVVKMG